MKFIDILIIFNEFWMIFKMYIAYIFTIKYDPINYSNRLIVFKNSKEFSGYKIIESDTEYSRRFIHWFYRTIEAPTINDWNKCIDIFNIDIIPPHVLQLYDKNNRPLDKYIVIKKIENTGIQYIFKTGNDPDNYINLPLGFASLVPDRFVFNFRLFTNIKLS